MNHLRTRAEENVTRAKIQKKARGALALWLDSAVQAGPTLRSCHPTLPKATPYRTPAPSCTDHVGCSASDVNVFELQPERPHSGVVNGRRGLHAHCGLPLSFISRTVFKFWAIRQKDFSQARSAEQKRWVSRLRRAELAESVRSG